MIMKVENGSFAYKNRHKDDKLENPKILDNVNFEVESGEILAVLGPNGAGKTTLLRCIMGMLKWDEGISTLDGADISQIPSRELWRKMAYVPQAKSAATSFTAFQTVLLGRSSRIGSFSSPKQEDYEVVEKVMKSLGIYNLADKSCNEISGGELQMVLIARALAAEPEILILDEPESNLDFRNQLIVLDTMSELASKGMACVFNTHYPVHALQRAHKSLLISKGADIIYGNTASVVTEENIKKAFGVNAMIGEVETPDHMVSSVVPISIAEESSNAIIDTEESSVASITIITRDNENSAEINGVLHQYNHLLIGRMGMPYRKQGMYIITINLDGRKSEIDELAHRLGLIRGISVKTTYASNSL